MKSCPEVQHKEVADCLKGQKIDPTQTEFDTLKGFIVKKSALRV